MIIYESKFMQLDFIIEHQLVEMNWLEGTSTMGDDDYKQEFLNYLEVIKVHRPQRIIGDSRKLDFGITPDLQEWTNQTVFPVALEMGLNKVALVLNNDLITQLSIEQTMEEVEGVKFITSYFDDKEAARKWIIAQP
jgi:hypothetical protein